VSTSPLFVDIKILRHLIPVGVRKPLIGAHVTLWFLMTILLPPVIARPIIDVSGSQLWLSRSVFLSTVDVAIRGYGAALKTAKQLFRRPHSNLDLERSLFDNIDAEINDREC
jgi:hypothetical protein